jgi:hypothetical protein
VGKLLNTLSMKVDDETDVRLDALHELVPIATRTSLAREALLLGLEQLERKPSLLLGRPKKKKRGGGGPDGDGR